MAKRSKPKSGTTARSHNPKNTIAKTTVLPTFQPSPSLPNVTFPTRPVLTHVEDRRSYHPEGGNRPAKTVHGRPAVITTVNKARAAADWANLPSKVAKARHAVINRFGAKVYSQTKGIRAFAVPTETIVCIRRQMRKEVLAAKRKLGGGNKRHGKLSWTSKISCRR